MLRSLRFQLPAFFLLGAVVAGLVSAVIALRLFRSYAEDRARHQAYAELAREASGLTQLYARQAGLKLLSAKKLELATGDSIYYTGLDPFPGQGRPAFTSLPKGTVNPRVVRQRGLVLFQFRPPGSNQTLLAAARPLKVGRKVFGVIVVAKPKTVLNQRWLALVERLLIAFAGGIAVAGAFAWYLSRRITSPVLELSRAADEVARGLLRRDRPRGAGRRRDRRPRRPLPGDGGQALRGRGARAQLPDVGLARAAHPADGDPRSRRGAAGGRGHRRGDTPGLADGDRSRGGAARGAPGGWGGATPSRRTRAGNATPKQTSGICTANDSACICRASSR